MGKDKEKKHDDDDDGVLVVKGLPFLFLSLVPFLIFLLVIQAKGIAAMDKRGPPSAYLSRAFLTPPGTSDPYAVVTSSFNKQKFKSKTHKKTLQPMWNEEFKLSVYFLFSLFCSNFLLVLLQSQLATST